MVNLSGETQIMSLATTNDKNLIFRYLSQQQELLGDTMYTAEWENGEKMNTDIQKGGCELTAFYHQIKDCQQCELGATRTNFVFGVGNPNADIVFVGEAPGKNEDLQGEPFVGRSGKLLNDILHAIGLTRDDIYILNVLKCRPPKNRDPLSSEVDECEPYLKTQLKMINPKLIVALGRIAGNTILRTNLSLSQLRENVLQYEGIDLIVTYHPAALLRNPAFKKPTWEDFKKIKNNYLN